MPGPVWKLDKAEMYDPCYRPTEEELDHMRKQLNQELDKLI